MVREFELPDVGEGVAEGELVSWLVDEGDEVAEDQPVAEVETDKALVEVPAPVDGTVRELHVEEGAVVPVGTVIISFDVSGETDAEPTQAAADAETTATGDRSGATGSETEAETDAVTPPDDRVFAPPRVRRLARQQGLDLSSLDGSGPGGRITAADVWAVVGDATAPEPEQPQSGEPLTDAEPAATADESSADTIEAGDAGSTTPDRGASSTRLEAADRETTLAAPATRRLAEEEGVDIDAVPAVDERDGEAFVTPEAVREYAETQRRTQDSRPRRGLEDTRGATADADREAVETTGPDFAPGERERREPFRGVRKRIAEAMVESKDSAPHVTHHDEVDVTALVDARKRLQPRAQEQGIRLTYMPFLMKAVVAALKAHPEMNAVIDEDSEEIVYRDYYNIGVATATDAGLMVPVVDDADRKGLLQLSSEMNELVQKARDRTISPDELQGSTFTITNVGGIGGEYATPILNYPETGILAIGEIKRKPRVVTDEDGTESIEPRSVLPLSLSFDHRLVDGAVGAQFTNTVMESLEHPQLLLLE